jgi:MerR HTH family regulatory protein
MALRRRRAAAHAARLAHDLEMNAAAVALVLVLLDRIERLEAGRAAHGTR